MSSSKKTTSTYHHGDLRNALIESGVSILQNEGMAALSLRRVSRLAKVSHAAPYRHFADKEALLVAISLQGFELLVDAMQDGWARVTDDSRQRLIEIGESYVAFGVNHPAHFSLMFSEMLHQTGDPELSAAASRSYEILKDGVRRAQAAGMIREGNVEDIGHTIWSSVHGMTMLIKEGFMNERSADGTQSSVAVSLSSLLDGLAPHDPGSN